ncbi:hypothetical protein HMPREF1870_01659 [Bacteroidales bacterium KA00344]|nr:hypothetical protein HMPREF1870_01659 [Bacteroidales bacterium KA00344]
MKNEGRRMKRKRLTVVGVYTYKLLCLYPIFQFFNPVLWLHGYYK